MHFFRITFKSSNPVSRGVNILWPMVPVAIAVRYTLQDNYLPDLHLLVPCYGSLCKSHRIRRPGTRKEGATRLGCADRDDVSPYPIAGPLRPSSRRNRPALDPRRGDADSCRLGSLVEIILFMVLLTRPLEDKIDYLQVVKAAILGSVLATMLLCLGLCFIAGGLEKGRI